MNTSKLAITFLIVTGLTACGGEGGTGTTGSAGGFTASAVVSGPITAFGSIFVNGVEYEIDDALANGNVLVNGKAATGQSELGEGMKVIVTAGTSNANGTVNATKVVYRGEVTGVPSNIQISSAGSVVAGTFDLLNQTVQVDALTVFHFDSLSAIPFTSDPAVNLQTLKNLLGTSSTVGVEVSGLPNVNGVIQATRVDVKTHFNPSDDYELRGVVRNWNGVNTFELGLPAVTVKVASSTQMDPPGLTLSNGIHVEVHGTFDATTDTLTTSKIEQDDASVESEIKHHENADIDFEVQGVVSNLDTNAKTFSVNGVQVSYGSVTKTDDEDAPSVVLADGVRVEVKGTVDSNGTLVAGKIEIKLGDGAGSPGTFVKIPATLVAMVDTTKKEIVLSDTSQTLVKVTATTLFRDERPANVTGGVPLNYQTAFDSSSQAAIQPNSNYVEVKGYEDATTGGVTAARIEVKSSL